MQEQPKNSSEKESGETLKEEIEELKEELEDKEETIEELKQRLEEKNGEIEKLESEVKRVHADFRNYKKRVKQRIAKESEKGKESIIKKILKIRDDLVRSLDFSEDTESVKKGLKLTLSRFDSILGDEGVEEIVLDGFDPEKCEAIATKEKKDCKDGDIIEIHQKGFKKGEKVLRPARVTVARDPCRKEQQNSENNS